jgi:hypothetical protein
MEKLLNPNSFWNLVFLAGTGMTIVSVASPLRIPWKGDEVLIRIPVKKQKTFLILGIVLIAISLIIVSIPSWAGFFSPAEKSPDTFSRETALNRIESFGFSLTQAAYAAETTDDSESVASFRLVQRRYLTINKHFEGKLGVYLGDVHLVNPNRIVLFVPQASMPPKGKLESMNTVVPPGSIIAAANITDGQSLEFTFEGKKYKLLAHFDWYIVGEDYGTFEVIPEPDS